MFHYFTKKAERPKNDDLPTRVVRFRLFISSNMTPDGSHEA